MSDEPTKLKLPSGKEAVIRSYTTHGDDRQAQAILNAGIVATTSADGQPSVTVSVEASQAAEDKYIELLVETIDGKPPVFDELLSDDYRAIAEAVKSITSPKDVSKS